VAQAAWPEFADLAAELRALWPALTPGEHLLRLAGGRLRLRLVFGDVRTMAPGVTVSADFETSGWTIAPKFDLSVVPTFGDKDADLKLGITGVSASDDLSVRVIDSNPVQATLGVSATNGAWGFGLNYKLGVGSDDRMNNSFNANVRYAF
jgi:outer membrane autotransporter protein